ncbi:MAG: RraA family protein [Candidatus Latescibacteria bacterium]|nr:RraA family protein [Candidatus Latescibacterota bacterium]
MTTISPQVLDKLRTFDTPTMCNLIELFDVRPRNTGYTDGRIRACFPELSPMVGFAATATFRSSGPPRSGDAYGSTEAQVERFGELSGPPVVVFQDIDDPAVAATFGEVMCTTYRAFGAQGLITSGAGRDIEQVRAISFPVFTNGTICAHGYCHILQIHVPVHVGGVVIYPNDLLHGDLNGVTTIPHDIAVEMADIGDAFVAAEKIILDVVRSPSPSVAQLREATAEAKERMAELRRQVSRAK